LCAKPILDIAVRVRSLSEVDRLIAPLSELGYTYKPNSGHRDRRFFTNGTHCESIYLHCFHARAFMRVVQFRDALRRSPTLRREYGTLKRRLARLYADNRAPYTAAKAEFVERVIRTTHRRRAHGRERDRDMP